MIYFDNNATTQLAPEVSAVMAELQDRFGNPSSIHRAGQEARSFINQARERLAACFHLPAKDFYFTSGGTESLNIALLGTFLPLGEKRHLILSSLEHPALLQAANFLEKNGIAVTYLQADSQGSLDLAELESAIRPDTGMIAVMLANNEIGNLYPVKRIGEIARERRIPYLCDGVQGVGKLELDLSILPIDYLAGAAHKFHGPKGVGFLYVRDGLSLNPLFHGGRQEKGLRPGTENLPGIVGMTEALELCLKNLFKESRQIRTLRDRLQVGILENFPELIFHGDPEHRLDNTLNFRIEGIPGESLLIHLDLSGIAASVGSACESGSLEPSHVLLAMGLTRDQAMGGLRFSLSRYNTGEEVDAVIQVLPKLVEKIREVRS